MQRFGVTFVQAATPFLADLPGSPRGRPRPRQPADVRGHRRGDPPGSWHGASTRGARRPRSAAPGARPRAASAARSRPAIRRRSAWGTDGRALDGVRLRVVDDDGRPLAAGEEGNFEVNSRLPVRRLPRPPGADRRGRHRRRLVPHRRPGAGSTPTATCGSPAGSRTSINRGGEKVPVAEIEQLLHAHPAVARRRDRRDARRAPRRARLRVRGARRRRGPGLRGDARVPRLVPGVQDLLARATGAGRALPRTPSGKIQKFVLRAQARELMNSTEVDHLTTATDHRFRSAARRRASRYVDDEGERWSELIERDARCHSSCGTSCATAATCGWPRRRVRRRGIPFTRYLELLELFSMSHASLRMIVHVANGVWRPMDQSPTTTSASGSSCRRSPATSRSRSR